VAEPAAGPAAAQVAPATTPAATTPAASADGAKASGDSDFTVFKVFYGTDRRKVRISESPWGVFTAWLTMSVYAAGVALILVAVGYYYRPTHRMRIIAQGTVLATGALVIATGVVAWHTKTSPWRPPRVKITYGDNRGDLATGECMVSVPKDKRIGDIQSAAIVHMEFHRDPGDNLVLMGIHPQQSDQFHADLRACVGKSAGKEALVFVHGYNVNFEDAACRTAQLAYDLKFDGAAVFFSWPSQGELIDYTVDEANVEWTVANLKKFLIDVARNSGAAKVHLIAHSMGNRAVANALRILSYETRESGPLFNEVILTAPDVDADVFRRDLAPLLAKTAKHVTLYASSNDEALLVSKKVHGHARAGETGYNLVVLPCLDTVDVSAVDTGLLGHSYYCESNSVLADMYDLIHGGVPADQRKWLHSKNKGELHYWVFNRE